MAALPPLSILLVGCLPPPVGGVSVHLQRLTARLEQEGHRWRLLDDARSAPLPLPLRLAAALTTARLTGVHLIHVHSGNWRTRCLCVLLGRLLGLPVLLTLHSFRPLDNPRTRWLARTALRHAAGVVAVSEDVRTRCLEHSARPERVTVQYAYLDPPAKSLIPLPAHLDLFLREHEPRLAAGASLLRFHDGVDLYGLDLLIDLFGELRSSHPKAGLVFVLPEAGLPEYLEQCRERLRELQVETDFLIVPGNLDFPALLHRCDLLLRPTTTDGDSLSLREALFTGCRALASDAVPRPEGVTTFRSRDRVSLLKRCRDLLAGPAPAPRVGQDGWVGLALVYKDLLHG
jgi:glycosyltransferase involved in cell wall biosynthesis